MTDPTAPAPRPQSQPWLRFVIDHNPFFILSAGSLLLGCRLLNDALHTPAGDISKLLVLLGIINLYELLIIPLGLVLIRRPWPNLKDGATLLTLEVLFLTDITFTTGLIATIDPAWGALIILLILALAGLKLSVILHVLHLPKAPRTVVFILLQLAAILTIPATFQQVAASRQGTLPATAVYLAWCVAGLLPVLGTFLHRMPVRYLRIYVDEPPPRRWVSVLYVVVPFVSLLVHLYSSAWVYSVPFDSYYVAPVLLGVAFSLHIYQHQLTPRLTARSQVILAITALWVSTPFPYSLTFILSDDPAVYLSPLRITLAGSTLLFLHLLWQHRRYKFLAAATATLLFALLGHSYDEIRANTHLLLVLASRSAPRSAFQWAVTMLTGTFLFLAAGALLSLRHRPRQEQAAQAST